MMASFMGLFGGRRDPKQNARDAIVNLRQQLQMLEKKEEFLNKKIEEELKKAKANAVTNKAAATAALRRKKAASDELDRIAGTRLQLEMQMNTLESANLNAETIAAMKKGAEALKTIHGHMKVEDVDAAMADIHEQTAVANEISNMISTPLDPIDNTELEEELAQLEEQELNDRLQAADHVPIHQPPRATPVHQEPAAMDEEEELRKLQEAMAL